MKYRILMVYRPWGWEYLLQNERTTKGGLFKKPEKVWRTVELSPFHSWTTSEKEEALNWSIVYRCFIYKHDPVDGKDELWEPDL